MANITTDTYQKKTWSENDIVTADDLNNIENGVSNNNTGLRNVQERATSLENRTTSLETKTASLENRTTSLETKTTSLESRATSLESRAKELETTTGNLVNDVNSLDSIVNDDSSGVIARITALENDAVLQSNFARQIEPHMSVSVTRKMHIDGVQLQVERKNHLRNILKYAFYKRSSSGVLNIDKTFEIPKTAYFGEKTFTFDIITLDSRTNDMEPDDISLFASVSKVSGVGSYVTSFKIEDNVLKFVASVLGGGVFDIYLTFSVRISDKNDSNFISY